MAVTTREELQEYALRKLGAPVIEINVDLDQMEDRIDEALEYYGEFHSDATVKNYLKHVVTQDDVDNGYITLDNSIIFVSKLFPIDSGSISTNFFDIKYQMMLNDIGDLNNFSGTLVYYEQMQQYLSLLDMKLNGQPQVNFSRRQNRLYIYGDFADGDIKVGDYIIAEVYSVIDAEEHNSIYNDRFVKNYTTALIKMQWGQNLIKFEGMQLPGGVTLNGRQIYEDAKEDVLRLEENMRLEYELPPDFYVG